MSQDRDAITAITEMVGEAVNQQLQNYLQYCWLNDDDNQRGPGEFMSFSTIEYLKADVWSGIEPPTYERRLDHAVYLLLESVWLYRTGKINDLGDAIRAFKRRITTARKIRDLENTNTPE